MSSEESSSEVADSVLVFNFFIISHLACRTKNLLKRLIGSQLLRLHLRNENWPLILVDRVIVSGAFEANVERPALLSDHALLALHLVAQRADPVNGGRRFVVALVGEVVDSQSFVASASSEVHDAALKRKKSFVSLRIFKKFLIQTEENQKRRLCSSFY